MADDMRLAVGEVYAKALFELARQADSVGLVGQELSDLSALVRSDKSFSVLLSTPSIDKESKQASLERIFKGRLSDLVYDFLMVVARHGRLGLLVEMQREYAVFADEHAGRVRGELVTAVELDRPEQARLAEQVGRVIHKSVVLTSRVDPSIIGGMILIIEGKVMDGSVRGRLQRMARAMRSQANRLSCEQE